MEDNKKIYFYIAANLAMLIPLPGRFVFAVYMVILFNIQMFSTTLLFHATEYLKLSYLRNSILVLEIIAMTILFKQILILFCPVIALTLGFCMYLPSVTSVMIQFLFIEYSKGVKRHTALNMKKALFMSLFTLFYFFMRDIIGYGTITLPGWKKIICINLPYNSMSTSASIFFSTIPGSLVFIAILLALYIKFKDKMTIFENSSLRETEK